jgi:CHAT domain-containing protein
MAEYQISNDLVREYLLGRVMDEPMLENIEDKLFADEEFCSHVALVEDWLINEFVRGHLNEADRQSFHSTLANDSERLLKVELTRALVEKAHIRDAQAAPEKPPFFAMFGQLLRQPKYAGAFAVILIAAVVFAVYLTRRGGSNDLAELRSIYRQARPTETRISDFDYAPYNQLRGAPEAAEQTRLRRIENNLIEATEKHGDAKSFQALGIFYLTQQNYESAIKQLGAALKLSPQDATIHNDLGSAYFAMAKSKSRDMRLEDLARSLEEFTRATEIDRNLLAALFNNSLALQELGMKRQAKESWTLYLEKDPTSQWAEEARKNLAGLASEQSQFKSDDEVLTDFLDALHKRDDVRAMQIHDATKGLLRVPSIPLQLTRRYLRARQSGNSSDAKDSLDGLNLIGVHEQAEHADHFFADLSNFYASAGAEKFARLQIAHAKLDHAHQTSTSDAAQAIREFESSRDLFNELGDFGEAAIAENAAVQFLPDVGRVSDARQRLAAIIESAEQRRHKVLLVPAYYWLGIAEYYNNEFSRSAKDLKAALQVARATNNSFEIRHAQDALAVNYFKLGEFQSAATYAGEMLDGPDSYFETSSQWLRSCGTLADVTLKLNCISTSLSFSRELISALPELKGSPRQTNDSLRRLILGSSEKRDFEAALRYAGDSMQIALNQYDGAEKTRATAELYLLTGDVRRQMKDYGEALADYDRAADLYTALPEYTFASYQIEKGRLFCFQALGDHDQFAAGLKKVLALSEQYRQTIREDESRRAFFDHQQDVFDAAIADSIGRGDTREAFTFAETSRARSLLEFVKSEKAITEIEKDFGSAAQPLGLSEIQSRMPHGVQLVAYVVLPDRLAIWIVSSDHFDLVQRSIDSVQLNHQIDAYQTAITQKAALADLRAQSQSLYQLLVPPDLIKGQQLCILPDKFLHRLSFATLLSPEGKYLVEDHALIYAPSASIMVLASENAVSKEHVKNEHLLAVGNPDFDRQDNTNLPDLRAAEIEAGTIVKDYEGARELQRGDATRDAFLREMSTAEVIHFAGHFVANQYSPANSKLLFAGDDVRSSELGSYRLPKAKLVVMSACETGFEGYDQGEGVIGIARTWLAMGVPVVVATQWKVDSDATKDLMIAFHRYRRQKGMSVADSLRTAQLDALKSDKTSAPFYWGAFATFGGLTSY